MQQFFANSTVLVRTGSQVMQVESMSDVVGTNLGRLANDSVFRLVVDYRYDETKQQMTTDFYAVAVDPVPVNITSGGSATIPSGKLCLVSRTSGVVLVVGTDTTVPIQVTATETPTWMIVAGLAAAGVGLYLLFRD